MEEPKERYLFGRKRTAAVLDISLRTLDNLVRIGQLCPIRIGKRIMFTRSAIERFIKTDHETKKA
jgi:hypothetical protein